MSLATSLATLATAVATFLVVAEMRRQRQGAYKPDLVVHPSVFSVFELPDSRRIPATLNTRDITTLTPALDNRAADVRLSNVGNGPAKNIRVRWTYDLNAFLDQIEAHTENGVAITDRMGTWFKVVRIDDNPVYLQYGPSDDLSLGVAVLEARDSMQLAIPEIYGELGALYVRALVHHLKPGLVTAPFSFPRLAGRLEYEDLEGRVHGREFILGFSFRGLLAPSIGANEPLEMLLTAGEISCREG